MSATTSSHAYGIGVIALIIGMGAVLVFYTSFWLPESLEKPSVKPITILLIKDLVKPCNYFDFFSSFILST